MTPVPVSATQRSAARPWIHAPSDAASSEDSPREASDAMIPASTSPEPAVASAGFPVVLMRARTPSEIIVAGPLRSATAPHFAASAFADAKRSAYSFSTVSPVTRDASRKWGVMIMSASTEFFSASHSA